jgi:hypothetical protein
VAMGTRAYGQGVVEAERQDVWLVGRIGRGPRTCLTILLYGTGSTKTVCCMSR